MNEQSITIVSIMLNVLITSLQGNLQGLKSLGL